MKVRQLSRRYGAISVSAMDADSLLPLLGEMEKRFWPDENPAT
jgi:GTP-binding protein HflX